MIEVCKKFGGHDQDVLERKGNGMKKEMKSI